MNKKHPVISTANDWPVRTVGEMTSVLRRGTAPVYVDESDVMAIGQRCITDSEFDGSRARPHSPARMSNVLAPEAGDVLINSTGTGTIGRSVIFRGDPGRYVVDGHVTVARPRRSELASRWLNDVLRSPSGQRYLESRCYSGSTNQVELSSSALACMSIAVPDVAEQIRVGAILDALDDQILASEKIRAKLALQGIGLVRDLLAPGVRGELVGYEAETASSWIKTSIKPWPLVPYAEVCSDVTVGIVVRPTQYYRASGIPVLRSANVRAQGIVLEDLKYMSEAAHVRMSKTAVKPGDLVTVRTGYPGATAVVPALLPEANCVDIIISRPGPRVLPEYLAIWVNSEFGKGQVLRRQGGLAQQHFNVAEMKSLRTALPSIPEQRIIVDTWTAFRARLESEVRTIDGLRALRMALLNDLLTGRVSAKHGPTA